MIYIGKNNKQTNFSEQELDFFDNFSNIDDAISFCENQALVFSEEARKLNYIKNQSLNNFSLWKMVTDNDATKKMKKLRKYAQQVKKDDTLTKRQKYNMIKDYVVSVGGDEAVSRKNISDSFVDILYQDE